jgi:hypothetical protein
MMSSIYTQAKEVVIWLGCDFEIIPRRERYRLSLLAALYSLLQPRKMSIQSWHAANMHSPAARLLAGIGTHCRESFWRLTLRSLRSARTTALWSNSYFDRRWVYSEMLLARRKRVFAGSTSMSWTELLILYKQITKTSELIAGYHMWRVLYTQSPRGGLLEDLLNAFHHTECQEHHDHVYAFLAACDNGLAFPVDYNCSLYELLLGTALFCICDWKLGGNEEYACYIDLAFGTTISELADVWNLHEQVSSNGVMKGHITREALAHYTDEGQFSVAVERKLRTLSFRCKTVAQYLLEHVQPCERSRENKSLTVPVPHAQGGDGYLERLFAASGVTHILHDNVRPVSILLSQREQSHLGSICFNVRGHLHQTIGDGLYTFTSEIYGSCGLPGIHVKPYKPDEDSLVFSDLRAPLIVLGLPGEPHQQFLRMAAFDILHDPVLFPLPSIEIEQIECQQPWSSDYTFINRTTWLPPDARFETPADEPPD